MDVVEVSESVELIPSGVIRFNGRRIFRRVEVISSTSRITPSLPVFVFMILAKRQSFRGSIGSQSSTTSLIFGVAWL